MKFEKGDKVKLLVPYYCVAVGSILEVVEKIQGDAWINNRFAELHYINIQHQEFELVERVASKPKRFELGDKVVSIVNTPEVPEGFVGFIFCNDSGPDWQYIVQEASTGKVEYFNEDELELLSASNIQDIKGVATSSDAVNSPKHYAVFDDIEAIEIIARSMTKEMFKGYCFGNLLKYRLRAGGKDDVHQELGKAEKYKELYEKYKEICQ